MSQDTGVPRLVSCLTAAREPGRSIWGEPKTGPDDPNAVRRQFFAGAEVLDDIDGPAEHQRSLFGLRRTEFDFADRIVGAARLLDERAKFNRLKRERSIDPPSARQRDMLLDDRCAERDGGDGGADPHRVIGKSDLAIEYFSQTWMVAIFEFSGVAG